MGHNDLDDRPIVTQRDGTTMIELEHSISCNEDDFTSTALNAENGEAATTALGHVEQAELTAFVHAALARGGPGMTAKYSAEKIANLLVARDIGSVEVLELILMDGSSVCHLIDSLEGIAPFGLFAPFGLIATMKAHLQSIRSLKPVELEETTKKSATELLHEWGFTEQLTLANVPTNTPLFDATQKTIMLPAYMAVVIKRLRNLNEQTETVDVGFTLILRINYGGIPSELRKEIADELQFRINELPARFDPDGTDAKWKKQLYIVTSRMVRLVRKLDAVDTVCDSAHVTLLVCLRI